MNKVLLIGCGHMGSALLTSWKDLKQFSFTVIDPFNEKSLKRKFKSKKILVNKSINNLNRKHNYDLVIFAIRPQEADLVLREYSFFKFKKSAVIISIIAGKKISFFNKNLKYAKQIIRVMPNMPSQIEKGLSCLVPNKYVSNMNKKKTNELFSKVGKTIWFSQESQVDMATAVSGSGPGYVFAILDAFEKSAIDIGFNKIIARKLVTQTFLGSLLLMSSTNKSPKELADFIAVKGGTTEAGLKVMQKNNIYQIFSKVVKASHKRAKILGKK